MGGLLNENARATDSQVLKELVDATSLHRVIDDVMLRFRHLPMEILE